MRREVTFQSEGMRCKGWLYLPDNLPAGTKIPGVVMADANCAVKEMVEVKYAEMFAAAGVAALAFDFRFLGESEGQPRNQIIYYDQHEDLRNAITFLSEQPEIDANRIGIWGISAGGGHAVHLAAFDKRIKAAVGVVPLGMHYEAIQPLMGPEGMAQMNGFLIRDRAGRFHGRPPAYLALVSRGNTEALVPNPAAYDYYMKTAARQAPNFRNQVTLSSIEKNLEFDPGAFIHLISPTPLLMVCAEGDMAIPVGQLMANAFQRAGEPKRMITLACNHTDVFEDGAAFTQAANASVDWFKQYLAQ
jgi:uncharacterized protein